MKRLAVLAALLVALAAGCDLGPEAPVVKATAPHSPFISSACRDQLTHLFGGPDLLAFTDVALGEYAASTDRHAADESAHTLTDFTWSATKLGANRCT